MKYNVIINIYFSSSRQINVCFACKNGGKLIGCDACSNFYHVECIEPPITRAPRGRWICSDCKDRKDRKTNIKYGKYYNIFSNLMVAGNAMINFENIALSYNILLLFHVNTLINFYLNTNVIKQFLSFNCVVSEGA